MKTCLTIAGSDFSGGAGIQADLKTFIDNDTFGMSAITALTAQNTQGVTNILDVDEQFLADQLDAIFTDIYPDSIKIGMVANPKLIKVIKEKLIAYKANNIVVDPVMVATSGANLTSNQAIIALEQLLFPIASLITPNINEAQII